MFTGCGIFTSDNVAQKPDWLIESIKMYKSDYSSLAVMVDEDVQSFYFNVRQLEFTRDYYIADFDEEGFEYVFIITYKFCFYETEERFALDNYTFYNAKQKRTKYLTEDNVFISKISEMFERAWQNKISEV